MPAKGESNLTEIKTPSWGIEPVPERLRVLGAFDGFLLWANLSVSLLVIVAGAFLARPASASALALSLPEALAAIVAASVVGNVLLGVGGLIGADARVPTMVLFRAPLGRMGSYLPTGLNVLQCLGWSVFELIIIATGASALSEQLFGFGGVAFWKILFGCVATALAFLGPVGFVRKYVRKFAVWVVIASLLYLSWWSLHGQHPVRLWHRSGAHAFWPGFDLVLASIISWTPLVADYTRFSRSRRAGFVGAGLGYFVPTIPLFALGAVIAMSRQISEAPALLTAIAAGGAASVLALLALTADESDEAFANVYSGAVSLQNLLPRVPQRLLVGCVAAVGRRLPAELRRGVCARDPGPRRRPEAYPRERVIALLGNLSRDLKPGLPPLAGGGPYHGARALRRLRVPARIVTRCALADRESLLRPLVRMGTPVRYVGGTATATFGISYNGDQREMRIEQPGGTRTDVVAHRIDTDPTGAGDAFMAAYVVARSAGFAPLGATRRATAVVAAVLAGR